MNLTKEEAIAMAKKALIDVDLWKEYKLSSARLVNKGSYGFERDTWIVGFDFTEEDWHNGLVNPTIMVDHLEKLVLNVSYKKSVMGLVYDAQKSKYFIEE